jgi:hypothetical protein
MQQSPSWEVNSHSASQEIPHLLWNLKVHHCVHKSLPLDPILSKINLVDIVASYIRSNLILTFSLRLALPYGLFHLFFK